MTVNDTIGDMLATIKNGIMLTKEEADKHDALFMHELAATIEDKTLGQGESKHWQEMRNLLDWFIKNNAKAYMVLLD